MSAQNYNPMTLGNMRANGVRTLAIRCGALWCNHEAILDVSDYVDNLTVPAFGPRMVCTVCGAIGADVRPNWQERALSPWMRGAPHSGLSMLIRRISARRSLSICGR